MRFVVAVPLAETYWLGTQLACATQTVAEFRSLSQVPAAHGTNGATSPAQYVPAAQAAQEVGAVGVPAEV